MIPTQIAKKARKLSKKANEQKKQVKIFWEKLYIYISFNSIKEQITEKDSHTPFE